MSKKKARCVKGKSCGLACINVNRICRKDINKGITKSMGGAVKGIEDNRVSLKSMSGEEAESKAKEALAKVKQAIISGDGKAYEDGRKEYEFLSKVIADKGGKESNVNLPPWDIVKPVVEDLKAARASKNEGKAELHRSELRYMLLKPISSLDKLETFDDFQKKKLSTLYPFQEDARLEDIHTRFAKLIGVWWKITPEEKELYDKLRKSVEDAIGEKGLVDGVNAIGSFTGNLYKEIKKAQYDGDRNSEFGKMAAAIERLLTRPEVNRPPVEKFRGKPVDDDTLKRMIEEAKANKSYRGRALTSWSTSLQQASDFSYDISNDNLNNRVILRAVNKRGVPIDTVSINAGEAEVLTPSSNYRYIGYKEIKELHSTGFISYHVFEVEEF